MIGLVGSGYPFEALESLLVGSENGEVDIDHERSIRTVDRRIVSRRHYQVVHALRPAPINAGPTDH